MSRLCNWFLSDPEFIHYDVSDDTASSCGVYNGSGYGKGSGNGSGDTNGKIIGYGEIHLHNFDVDPHCGIRGGSGVGYGFGDCRGHSNGRGY